MNFFAVQVWTGKERDFADRVALDPRVKAEAIVPMRAINERKRGRTWRVERPLFAGYAFIATEAELLDPVQRWALRSTRFFIRALPTSADPRPVKEGDRRLIAHFMSFGKVADVSKVTFDENERIVVVEGPLKGLEALIERVDKRKRRAKIRLAMCEDSFLVDLGFELLDRSAKGSVNDDGKRA